jgi:hypothetical protein
MNNNAASGSQDANAAAANQSSSAGANGQQLPQTASILPLLGLGGLGTFFAGLIARFRR